MKRVAALLSLLLLAAVPAWAGELPVVLRQQAQIQADVVRLGDIWDNLGAKADVVLAGAPQPGKRIVGDARWLSAVAQANGIAWVPTSAFDRITIERAGETVDIRLVEAQLRDALAMEGVAGNFTLDISNRSALSIMVPAGDGDRVAIRDTVWDPRTSRFSALVEVPAGAPDAVRQRINGRVFGMVKVPVLARPMNRGDVIAESDLKWIDMRSDQIRQDALMDVDQIVGQEPRSPLRADAPVRQSELRRPVLVERNALVTVSLRTPFMSLTSQAKAMDAGSKGDVIRITNLQSKRTVEAVVEGPGMVSISPNGPRVLTN